MQFHQICSGSSIRIEAGGRRAVREADSFCNGVVFTRFPLVVGAIYCLEVGSGGEWSGSLRLGVTTHSPDLSFSPPPRYACPDLIAREGYWARPVRESVATHGSRLAFSLVPGGQLRLFVNNHHVGRHLTGLPTDQPLWGLVDVYGNTTSVTFVREESVPVEVLSRGQHAVDAFLQAQESGTLPIYRGRLCVLGPPSVGKTSLVRALLGQKASVGQQSTEGIALSHCWATSVGEGRKERKEMKARRDPKVQPYLDQQQHEAFPCLDFEPITITAWPTLWQGRWLDLQKPPDLPPASKERRLPSPPAPSPPSSGPT